MGGGSGLDGWHLPRVRDVCGRQWSRIYSIDMSTIALIARVCQPRPA